ncbi:polymorphic toxin-type HINT domain-containing protein [Streptomyces nigrescens]
MRVTVTGPGARSSGTVTATGKHPFWAAGGRNAWRDAEQLKPGERLLTEAGSQARIDATKSWTTSRQCVHNLTVADLHTYYVPAGETPVLDHNTNPGDCFRGARPGESPSFHPRPNDYRSMLKPGSCANRMEFGVRQLRECFLEGIHSASDRPVQFPQHTPGDSTRQGSQAL